MIIKNGTMDQAIFNEAYEIRKVVFVEEQQIPIETEIDENDPIALHYVGYVDGQPISTARAVIIDNKVKIGRVATLINYRQKGYARLIIEKIIADNQDKLIYLHAQLTAYEAYLKMDFVPYGSKFYEEGIEHIAMKYVGADSGNY